MYSLLIETYIEDSVEKYVSSIFFSWSFNHPKSFCIR